MQEPAAMEITAIRRLAGTALTWVGVRMFGAKRYLQGRRTRL